MWIQSALSLLLLLGPAPAALGKEVQGTLPAHTRWEGEITLKGAVTVPPGAVLTIAPGTRIRPAHSDAGIAVQGRLMIRGTAEQPVVFRRTSAWRGIEFYESRGGNTIEYAHFEGAETAISALASAFTVTHAGFKECGTAIKLVREATLTVEDSRFADNRVGVDNQMKSAATLRRNRFSGHRETAILVTHSSTGSIEENHFEKNQQGIVAIQKFSGRILGNIFRNNKTAIFCNQTQSTPLIRNNLFEKNENALVNVSFAYPMVESNRFLDNATAIRNDQFGSPRVIHNQFRGNTTALFNNRKSNPQLEKNQLENNRTAIFCDYSSYPRVRENNFRGNTTAVKLGIHQSADWEKRSGSKAIMAKSAAERNSRNPLLAKAPTTFTDQVDVSGNWWGEQTADLARAGKGGNLPFFHDRLDQPEVSYKGFGPEKYRLDQILFAPWLEAEVPDAGPENRP